MLGLKKLFSRGAAAQAAAPSAGQLAADVPDELVRQVDVEWDHATLVLTASDAETGDMVAASRADEVVVKAAVNVVRGFHLVGASTPESLTAAMAALKMVGIEVIDPRAAGRSPVYL